MAVPCGPLGTVAETTIAKDAGGPASTSTAVGGIGGVGSTTFSSSTSAGLHAYSVTPFCTYTAEAKHVYSVLGSKPLTTWPVVNRSGASVQRVGLEVSHSSVPLAGVGKHWTL